MSRKLKSRIAAAKALKVAAAKPRMWTVFVNSELRLVSRWYWLLRLKMEFTYQTIGNWDIYFNGRYVKRLYCYPEY